MCERKEKTKITRTSLSQLSPAADKKYARLKWSCSRLPIFFFSKLLYHINSSKTLFSRRQVRQFGMSEEPSNNTFRNKLGKDRSPMGSKSCVRTPDARKQMPTSLGHETVHPLARFNGAMVLEKRQLVYWQYLTFGSIKK